jgi:hypothetical protein
MSDYANKVDPEVNIEVVEQEKTTEKLEQE